MDRFDRDLAAMLGVEEECDELFAEGEEEQEGTDPAAGNDEKGVREQEGAAPADVDDEDDLGDEDEFGAAGDDPAAQEPGLDGTGAETTPPGQSPEDNARFAAARRRAEQERDDAVARAREEAQVAADRAMDEAFATAGLHNPYTGELIRSKAEFEVYRLRHVEEQRKSMMSRVGMTDEQYRAFVDGLPEVQQARQAEAAAAQARARMDLQTELDKIKAIDSTITDPISLGRSERFAEVRELVQRGYALSDAYKLIHYDRLTAAKAQQQATNAAKAQRQAEMSAASKQHLHRSPERSVEPEIEVPEKVKAQYRRLEPGITDAEIRADYKDFINKNKES